MKVAIAQIAPIFLDRAATIAKVVDWVQRAANAGAELVAFGESLIPGYPLWLCRTDAARFDADDQKELHALFAEQAVVIPEARGENALTTPDAPAHLMPIQEAAKRAGIAVILGATERAIDRGGHSLFCSCVTIGGRDADAGRILSVHRKLMPTYEERLVWGVGDGAGLVTHRIGGFTVGALNCWENWMPLARSALYAAGEDLHVMVWPGSDGLTRDITRFVALEGRSYVMSASAILRASDIPSHVPLRKRIANAEWLYNGGSCIADPRGEWVAPPTIDEEKLIVADIDPRRVLGERQNFDAAGHYSRPDVLKLLVRRERLAAVEKMPDRDSSS